MAHKLPTSQEFQISRLKGEPYHIENVKAEMTESTLEVMVQCADADSADIVWNKMMAQEDGRPFVGTEITGNKVTWFYDYEAEKNGKENKLPFMVDIESGSVPFQLESAKERVGNLDMLFAYAKTADGASYKGDSIEQATKSVRRMETALAKKHPVERDKTVRGKSALGGWPEDRGKERGGGKAD